LYLSTALFLAAAAAGTLQGTVRSAPSGEPVPYAVVEVAAAGRRATADARGDYLLAGLPAGPARVSFRAPGHDPAERQVVLPDGVLRLDVALTAQAVALGAVDAVASATRREDETGPQGVLLDAASIRALPALAEPDVLRAAQSLPAVAAVSDYSSALYVRGGSPDQTLLTLDGTPLFNPYHLAGLFSAIDPDAVAAVEVRPGALPAELGDRLSGAVEVYTREGGRDRVRTTGAVGLVSSRFGLDGPLPGGRGSFLLSARRTYLDVATGIAEGLGFVSRSLPYSFTDGHAKLTFPAGGGRLSVSGYLNDERFELPDGLGIGDATWAWGSRALSARYRASPGEALLVEAHGAVSHFGGRLEDYGGPERAPVARTSMRDLLAGVDVARYGRRHRVRAGVQVDAYRLSHTVTDRGSAELSRFLPPLERRDEPLTVAVHLSDEWSPGERFRARAGVRVLHVVDGATAWMQRVGVRWALSEAVALTAGAGRYAQAVHTLRDEESVAASFFAYDLLVAPPPGGPLPTADDAVVGVEWSTTETRLRVDAFVKRYRDLPLAPLAADPRTAPALVADSFTYGRGRAAGVEVLARHERGPRTLTLAYALAFGEREAEGERFAPRYERRHTLDLSAALRLGEAGQAGARLVWQSGQPYTPAATELEPYRYDPVTGALVGGGPVVVYGAPNSARLPAYLRLDAGFRRSYRRRWWGRDGTVTPYVQVLNVLGSRNVVWASPLAEGPDARLRYGPQLPVLPTVGVEWRF
jgi:Carboxypeptidase regulatory-like domain/TonB dependent receptor/TonB-dependent Receptor Plug Domain